jgi:ferredoxin-NADP reductase
MSGAVKIAVIVTDIVLVIDMVTRFEFKRRDGGLLPTFSGGAHTVVEMRDGGITRLTPYSLTSDPFDQTAYTILIRRDDAGWGYSLYIHQKLMVGDEMAISTPVNLFSLDLRAKKLLFIAGGIAITPFLAQIKRLDRAHGNWELHYACRSKAHGSYADYLTTAHPNDVTVYYDEQAEVMDLDALLCGQALGTHVYACGPKGMIEWVRTKAAELG